MKNERIKRYPKYKESGIPWIGEIPEYWEVKKLKYEFKFITGFTPPSGKNEYYENGTHIWVNISDMNKKYIDDSEKKITDKAIEDFNPQIVPKGSLLYSFKLTVGKTAFVLKDCYTNEAIFSVLPSKDTNLNFFYYALPEQVIKNANENIYGAKILNQELIKNAYLIIPPKNEQSLIANYLDRKTAEIDDLIAKKERLIELYEEEKRAIINKAVTKGLNPNVKMKDSGIPWLGEIPEHWEVKKLKYVAKFILTGKTPPSNKGEYFNGHINWYTPGDFEENELFLKNSKKKITEIAIEDAGIKLYPPKTVLLVGIGATLGKIACIEKEGASNQQINAILFDESEVNFKYGLYFLFSFKEAIIRLANAATLSIFNQSQTKDFVIFVPSLSEQQRIVFYIEKQISLIDSKIEKTKKVIELLKEYKISLISEVVTGKRKVL